MEKYGVNKEILHEELRSEESRLMIEMQRSFQDQTKTASEKASLENKLQAVRQKLTDLDLGTSSQGGT